jgi:hypothetical protein
MDLLVSLKPELMDEGAADDLTALFKRYEIYQADAPLLGGLAYDARLAKQGAVWDLGISAIDTQRGCSATGCIHCQDLKAAVALTANGPCRHHTDPAR